jgi:SpoVK/Ycf46/Vps4 family AAA+-type ATPase
LVGLLVMKELNVRFLGLKNPKSKEPVHILLVGRPGQAKTLFLKCILETFGEKKAFFTVGGNASKV